jgi:preprotein translocase subunit YajC
MVFSTLLATFVLFAEDAPAGGGGNAQQPGGSILSMLPIFALIMVAFYFLMVRPIRQQEKQKQALLAAMKKNDKVVTQGGIIGVVANINDKQDEVTLKIDENANVRLRVTKSSIVRVITPEEAAKEQKEGGTS